MAWEDFLQPPGKVMRKETRSPILAVCRTLEEQSEVPWNNDSLHSAIKGAEPGENSRRLNQLFLGSSKVLHMQSAGAAGTNCVLWEEKGELPWAQTWGTTDLGRVCHSSEFGCWSRGDAGGTPGRVTGSPLHLPMSRNSRDSV